MIYIGISINMLLVFLSLITFFQFIPGKGLHMNEEFDRLMAIQNPALQTFKARKPTKGQFIPGKGMHANEEFEML
jgi:hypothetical protein